MIRFSLKFLLALICAAVLCTLLSYLTRCGDVIARPPARNWVGQTISKFKPIDCHINGDYHISCRKEGTEVYLPFSFIQTYFEVYGKLGTHGSEEIFEWNHSYSKVYQPKGKYNPRGVFMYFENYNVEVRDRVKCISAIEGVPVSTQWDANGYFYPIQIAQFGLSHFSKNLTDAQPRVTILEDGYSSFADWVAAEDSVFKRRKEGTYHVLNFSVKDPTTPGIVARVDKLHPSLLILQCVIKMVGNGSLAVAIEDKDRGYTFSVIYTCSQDLLTVQGNDVIYGLGDCAPDQWHYLTRDLAIDLLKGHVVAGRGKKISRPHLRLLSLTLKGQGQITNLSFSSSAHDSQFKSASEWLVKHQDTVTGGWPIPVRRRFGPGIQDLDPGWISAMGQGQAMSLLVRAYNRTGDEAYLRAALNAVKPFQVASSDGGVLAKFMNMYVWYEEYPTTPPSFVLNGFIYSLIGLYDLLTVADQFQSVKRIFDAGMASLKKLLPLYDTGSGSTYDLRHVMLGSAPNIARWDYHSTHVNQLLLLSTIDKDPILKTTAHRWMSYMKGKRAPHN